MKVSKWGNSLAVRLPAAAVEAFGLKEGDEITIKASERHTLTASGDRTREERSLG